MSMIVNASADELHAFIDSVVEKGSTIITNGWSGYNGISSKGYSHEIQIKKDDDTAFPHVHYVISLLKRWMLGTPSTGARSSLTASVGDAIAPPVFYVLCGTQDLTPRPKWSATLCVPSGVAGNPTVLMKRRSYYELYQCAYLGKIYSYH